MLKIKQKIFATFLALALSSASAWGAGYGLFVGIDQYDPDYIWGSLESCVNDASGLREMLLSDASRWPAANLTLLADRAAAKRAIRSKLAALAAKAVSGDVVVFFQSSHGGQKSSTETYLCAYDDDYLDSELALDLQAFRSGVSVVMVVDACHSGGLFKKASSVQGEWNFAQNVMAKMAEARAKSKAADKGANIGWITACKDAESSMTGEPYSLFVGYFLRGFLYADNNSDGLVSFYELYHFASPFALADNPGQHAQVLNTGLLASTAAKAIGTPAAVSLQDALDTPGLGWETAGNRSWYGQTRDSSDGSAAAHTGVIGNNGSSWLQTTVQGPGVLRFKWKASSESDGDFLSIYCDGVQQGESLSGETAWISEQVKIGEGAHTVRWVYAKNGYAAAGSDCGWVDQVQWLPLVEASVEATVGVAFAAILPDLASGPAELTVRGLPAGLKYDRATGAISGVPTKEGVYAVEYSAKGIGSQTVNVNVAALPAWAQGTFNGYFESGGVATMTISAVGKVTGKLSKAGVNYSFSAKSFASGCGGRGFEIAVAAKAGREAQPLELVLAPPEETSVPSIASGRLGDKSLLLWRNVWSSRVEPLLPLAGNYFTATLPGNGECGRGYLTFTVDKHGGVKIGGRLADGTAVSQSGTLVLDQAGRVFAVVYLTPKTYRDGRLFGLVEFVYADTPDPVLRPLDGRPLLWENRDPQATGWYGYGFARELGLAGGRYDQAGNLRSYYEKGLAVGGIDDYWPLPIQVKITNYEPGSETVPPRKITWTEEGESDDAGFLPIGLSLTLNAEGTAFSVAKSPVPSGMTGSAKGVLLDYYFGKLENPCNLAFSFVKATGLFKGAFNVYYDYVSAVDYTTGKETWTQATKRAAFQGVFTPVRQEGFEEGGGFILWPGKSYYESAAGKRIAYAYNGSYPFLLLPSE